MRKLTLLAALGALSAPLHAEMPLAGLAFLVGDWDSGKGQVADTGGTSRGRSTITREAGGNVLLRRDHTDLFDPAGKPAGSFEQVMMIYPEGGAIHADYSDGSHVIHYTGAEVVPGRSVRFTSVVVPNAPRFRLTYALADPAMLSITFETMPPGGSAWRPIASGTLRRAQ